MKQHAALPVVDSDDDEVGSHRGIESSEDAPGNKLRIRLARLETANAVEGTGTSDSEQILHENHNDLKVFAQDVPWNTPSLSDIRGSKVGVDGFDPPYLIRKQDRENKNAGTYKHLIAMSPTNEKNPGQGDKHHGRYAKTQRWEWCAPLRVSPHRILSFLVVDQISVINS
jgi:hypothetical protein